MNKEDLTPTQIAIIALIRAPDAFGEDCSPIPGRIHLVKEVFAIYSTELGKQLLPELRFEPDNFGPFDETIFAALDDLEDGGLIEFHATEERSKIALTPKGKEIANKIWERINGDARSIVTYVKLNFNHRSSKSVLKKIYAAHPEMAKYSVSKLADQYRLED